MEKEIKVEYRNCILIYNESYNTWHELGFNKDYTSLTLLKEAIDRREKSNFKRIKVLKIKNKSCDTPETCIVEGEITSILDGDAWVSYGKDRYKCVARNGFIQEFLCDEDNLGKAYEILDLQKQIDKLQEKKCSIMDSMKHVPYREGGE